MKKSDYKPFPAVNQCYCEHVDTPDDPLCRFIPATWVSDRSPALICQAHYDALPESEYIAFTGIASCEYPSCEEFRSGKGHRNARAAWKLEDQDHYNSKDNRPCYVCDEHYELLTKTVSPILDLANIPTSLSEYLAMIEEAEDAEV